MTNYILLIIGCALVTVGYHHYLPMDYGAVCNIVGIITTIHAITWDYGD